LAANNYLTFEDIKLLTSNVNFSTFNLSPQFIDNLSNVLAFEKTSAIIELGIDETQTDNVYTWYKDNVFYQTTSINELAFNNISYTDAGVYTCIVSNSRSDLIGIVLNSKPITFSVSPCIIANNVRYEILTTDCSYPIKVSIDESSFTGGTKPFTYTVKFQNDSSVFGNSDLTLNKEGVFDLIVKDALGCNIKFSQILQVPHNQACDPVFYPNGDGIADLYFIQAPGQAKIYNREGDVVNTITAPGYWDGTTSNGKEAPSGLYVIEINNQATIRITLLR
jgi:hypothetical protein